MNKETEILLPFGVYFHEKKGFAIAEKPVEEKDNWAAFIIDKNEKKAHMFFSIKENAVYRGSGAYFMRKLLKGYEYWGEL